MFCQKCGGEIPNEAVVCKHCGCAVKNMHEEDKYNKSKTGIGVLFELLLGIIGLIIGICIYPVGSKARQTFMRGWGITFAIKVVLYIVLFIIVGVTTNFTTYYYN